MDYTVIGAGSKTVAICRSREHFVRIMGLLFVAGFAPDLKGCDEWLRQGRIFRTREAALQYDRAMILLNGGEVE